MVTAYNGWLASPNPADFGGLDNRDVPGAPGVKLAPGVRAGDVATVLFYVASQLHKRVEPGVMPGCWGYSYRASKNSAALLSTHSAGCAFDWNAPRHPNGKSGTFSKAQVAEIGKIIREVDGVVYWGGGGWGAGTWDEMHVEITKGAAAVAAVAARLRSQPTPPTSEEDDMANSDEILAIVKELQVRLRGPSDKRGYDMLQSIESALLGNNPPGRNNFHWLAAQILTALAAQQGASGGPAAIAAAVPAQLASQVAAELAKRPTA